MENVNVQKFVNYMIAQEIVIKNVNIMQDINKKNIFAMLIIYAKRVVYIKIIQEIAMALAFCNMDTAKKNIFVI